MEAFTIEQLMLLEAKMHTMDDMINQSNELLDDIKSQEVTQKALSGKGGEDPLMQLLWREDPQKSSADLRCRSTQAVQRVKERSVSWRQQRIDKDIENAQNMATKDKGKS